MENTLIYDHFKLEELSNISNIETIRKLANKIDEIYFTNFSASRNEELKSTIMEIIKLIDENLQNSNVLNKTEISFLYFTKSLCLDKLPNYSKQAEESASKSVNIYNNAQLKLNPFNADNYNCIAHIVWKKGDIDSAINYFQKALEIDQKNKTSLRCLSMIVRSRDFSSIEEKQAASKLSLEYGKKAVGLDLKDSESWYVYANAYFFKAFIDKTQYEDLKLSLNSYTQAEKLQKKYKNPDLFYNRGVVHTYLENYNEAYKDYLSAHAIDSNLNANENADYIYSFLIQTYKFIKNECTLKPKKLSHLVSTIPVNLKDNISFSLADFPLLQIGENKNKLISAKIIQPINKSFEVPLSMICVDNSGCFFNLSIYNVSKSFIESIKFTTSNVVILDPVYKIVTFTNGDKSYEYPCIQVSNLAKILIDGKFCANFSSNALLNSKFFN